MNPARTSVHGARTGIGRAHAKSILLGEHAVVYGTPAIAVPLHALDLTVRVAERADEQIHLRRTRGKQRVRAGASGSTTGQHIIHQQNLPAPNLREAARVRLDRATELGAPRIRPLLMQRPRRANPAECVEQRRAPGEAANLPRQQGGLVVAPGV